VNRTHRSSIAGEQRRGLRAGWVGLVVLAAAALLYGCPADPLPTGAAEWIWASTTASAPGEPAAFVLLRDFELEEAPRAAARLFVLVDHEYAVHLNGHQIARGNYRRGEPTDDFQVAHLLRAGANRLAIEVRTPYGDGGVLAGIELDDGSRPVVTDDAWRVLERWDPRLVKGEAALGVADPPLGQVRAWGRPPVGRWGRIDRGEMMKPDPIWRAAGARRIVRVTTSPGVDPGRLLGDALLVDFGREVRGVLELELNAARRSQAGGLRFCLAGDCERRPLVRMPGRPSWRDTTARHFDTVIVTGVASLRAARARS